MIRKNRYLPFFFPEKEVTITFVLNFQPAVAKNNQKSPNDRCAYFICDLTCIEPLQHAPHSINIVCYDIVTCS